MPGHPEAAGHLGAVLYDRVMHDWTNAMRHAVSEAKDALGHGDVPVGAVLLDPAGETVAADHNRREALQDPTAHAEMLVIARAAQAQNNWRLDGHTLVVTLEPCAMCAGAISWAKIERIVFGAADLKTGAVWSLYNISQDKRLNHQSDVVHGVMEDECAALLTEFFGERR